MDSPFYGRSYWKLPSRYAPSVKEIPVQFFGSEEKRPSRSDSAVKIQKVFRGFLVRKSLKKIAEIRSELEEIEKRISKEEIIDLIANDSKERLRINEMLMSFLFRLDSVRGVDSGVRDCRKAVIKKAIALQELVDDVVSSNYSKNDQIREKIVEAVDDQNPTAQEVSAEDCEKTEALDDKEEAIENQNEAIEDSDVLPSVSDGPEESQTDSSANPEACEEDENSSPKQENNAVAEEVEENVKVSGAHGKGEENKKNRELLGRMIEDNERMMDLMAQLFEKNEMQTRLLSSLSQRVEQLERAFVCERLMRTKKKKKKRNVAGTVETTLDNKKYEKRE